ncbi:Tat pathway signal protein [Labrys wisconsinensis]|uniref:Tat pathway signal protein n=1 Tax=Labrys wisconsinensis TaxID=425677 RepID=A0ABU0JCF8_9HYPH|nr:Tat pathway signal protein [Labrys wisconsinensis]MDQ0471966.1 hypothetical protein [Labrys wisconsinensis]
MRPLSRLARTWPWLVLAGLAAGPAVAAPADVTIELNKVEPQGDSCRAYFVVRNTGGPALDTLKIDVFAFDRQGIVARRLALELGPSPVGKTSVRLFDVGLPCDKLGSLLLNDVLACQAAGAPVADCAARLGLGTRTDVDFSR